MGTFRVPIEIGDPRGSRFQRIETLVDTGASYTWMPREVLEQLDVQPQRQREFQTADGRIILRDIAQTWVRHNGDAHITFVVFGDQGSLPLLGAYTLEGFGLAVDPVNQRLVQVRGLAMAVPRGRTVEEQRVSRLLFGEGQ